MTRQARHTWILVAVVAALGLAAIGETLRDRRNAPRPLLDVVPARIDRIVLECASCGTPRRFQRVQGRWEMTQPWAVPAAAPRIERLLGIPATPVRRRFGAPPADAAALGFAPPFARITLGELPIEFGTTDAIDNARYVRSGDEVALIPDRISVELLAAPERFVDLDPFAGLHGGVVAVEEAGAPWPDARVREFAGWRAEDVVALAADAPQVGRALRVRDGGGREHDYLLAADGGHLVLQRAALPLGWVLPAGTAAPVDR
jgi:hypothetical protein